MKAVPHAHVKVVELVVCGPWQDNDFIQLESIRAYCEAFFSGMQVRVNSRDRISLSSVAEGAREGDVGQLQLCVDSVFAALARRKMDRDVLVSVAVTVADLYPVHDGQAWNFCFGCAQPMGGVGVFSFSRYFADGEFPLMWGSGNLKKLDSPKALELPSVSTPPRHSPESDEGKENGEGQGGEEKEGGGGSIVLRRACAVLAHEICHLLGIRHCIYFACCMQGSNHLQEDDARPLALCPIDLRKLQTSLKFDAAARHRALAALLQTSAFQWEELAKYHEQQADMEGVATNIIKSRSK